MATWHYENKAYPTNCQKYLGVVILSPAKNHKHLSLLQEEYSSPWLPHSLFPLPWTFFCFLFFSPETDNNEGSGFFFFWGSGFLKLFLHVLLLWKVTVFLHITAFHPGWSILSRPEPIPSKVTITKRREGGTILSQLKFKTKGTNYTKGLGWDFIQSPIKIMTFREDWFVKM